MSSSISIFLMLGLCGSCGRVVTDLTAVDAGIGNDSGTDAGEPLALPEAATARLLTPDGIDLTGASELGQGRVIVGSRRASDSINRDGVVVQLDSAGATATFVGGSLNDQLYAVATKSNNMVAVGLTRSFRSGANGDQSLVVRTTPDGLAAARYFIESDQAIQLRAVGPHPQGWVSAGRHLDGGQVVVIVADSDTVPSAAVTFDTGLTSHEVRAVKNDGGTVYVVGYGDLNGESAGYILALDNQSLIPVWSRLVTASGRVELHAVDIRGNQLVVVGRHNGDGLVISLDSSSGQLIDQQLLEGRVLLGARLDGEVLWVAGSVGTTTWTGIVGEQELKGVSFDDLAPPSPSAIPLTQSVSLIGSRAGGFVEIPLNETPVAQCAGALFGSAFSQGISAANTTVSVAAITPSPITISFAELPNIVLTSGTLEEVSACP